ncbi:MAG: prohibitin family protein [Deltaproteobacteria bacterium]|nr:prohibitin family protein [Deltaproteobacteria bacterium]
MTAILLGIFIAVAILVFGRNLPWLQNFRWFLAIPVLLVFFLFSMVKIVSPGYVGVLILFGKIHGTITEGLHLVNPLVTMEIMSVRTQEIMERAEVPSQEGLNVGLEVSCLYHLLPQEAARVYQQIGPRYQEVVVKPQFRAAIRGVTVRHEARALYTSGRELVASEIFKDLSGDLKARGIMVESILLRRMQLPKAIEDAINAKLAADQEAQRMRFILDKEKLEADRKRIEAQGIQDFQRIVSLGISDHYLRWKGIEATEQLAKSNNAKIVIIGGRDGLPLILNTGPEGTQR